MNESCRRKTMKVYQNTIWLMFLQKIALYMCFLVFVKKFTQYCRSFKRQFHPTNLPNIFFSDANFHFFTIFETLNKPLYFYKIL